MTTIPDQLEAVLQNATGIGSVSKILSAAVKFGKISHVLFLQLIWTIYCIPFSPVRDVNKITIKLIIVLRIVVENVIP